MTALPSYPGLEASSPTAVNVFLAAARWLEALLLGPLATSIAVIAIAAVGLLMLSGRINVRRGASVVLGCFILFGAASIAQGLRELAGSVGGTAGAAPTTPPPEPPLIAMTTAQPEPPMADPYAGAALRR